MPELPEVETIRNNLHLGTEEVPSLVGKVISGARLLWERTLATPDPQSFQNRIAGQRIESIGRRGKFLILHLSEDTLLIHLRMSGDLWVEREDDRIAPHHRLIIDFEDHDRLVFNDPRKFGRVWLVPDPAMVTGSLGPEPLDPNFDSDDFHARLHSHRRQLKPLLLDQSFLAGLGNIYTDEALHLAGLHPLRLSNQLSRAESKRLLDSIRHVLREGIRMNGTSIDWVYRGGDFQHELRAYGRTGQPCPVCGTPIERISVGQRGTHFCPACQSPPDTGSA